MSQIIQRSNLEIWDICRNYVPHWDMCFIFLFIYLFIYLFFCFGGDPVSIGISMAVSWMHHISNPLVDL